MTISTLFSAAVLLLLMQAMACYGQSTTNYKQNDKREVCYQQDVDVVDAKAEILNRRVQELSRKILSLEQENKELKQENNNRFDGLEQKVHNEADAKAVILNQTVQELSGKISSLEQENMELKQEYNNRLDALEQKVHKTPVAFAAHSPGTGSSAKWYSGVLKFKTIVTNLGSHYDNSSGQFTCPVKGLYVFMYNVLADNLKDGQPDIYVTLRINGKKLWYAFVQHTGSSNANVNCGGSVILECEAGSLVDVYKEGSGQAHYLDDTWFTGMLIQPM